MIYRPARAISIADVSVTEQDTIDLIAWLAERPRLTMGEQVNTFEQDFAGVVGRRHAIMVNSGSSANLLMLWSLVEAGRISRKSTVLIPALCWATDVAPLEQLGMNAVVVDVDVDHLGFSEKVLEMALDEYRPDVVLNVTPMGVYPQMVNVGILCERYGTILLEDNCDSLGCTGGVGTTGLMSSYSFYWGHHLTTIEGGMVTTDDFKLANVLRSVRSHGWSREFDPSYAAVVGVDRKNPNEMYTFYHSGFNMRSTEINAFLGWRQLRRFPDMVTARKRVEWAYRTMLQDTDYWTCRESDHNCLMGFPLLTSKRVKLQAALAEAHVESRPLLAGNICQHPAYYNKMRGNPCVNAEMFRMDGMYLPLHPGMNDNDVDMITNIMKKQE